mgnify:CR=1 FL=1
MAGPIIGDTGTVAWGAGGYTTNVKAWSLNIAVDEHDITDFASSGWAEYMGGLKRWSGSFECFLDDTTAIDEENQNTLTLTASTGRTFEGTAFITANDVTVNPADPNTVTVNFRGTSTLTIS